jgi:hypothetical protein
VAGIAITIALMATGVAFAVAQTAPRPEHRAPAAVAPLLAPSPQPQAGQGSTFIPPPAVGDEPDIEWRAANDEAARLKGHVGQIREPAPGPRR